MRHLWTLAAIIAATGLSACGPDDGTTGYGTPTASPAYRARRPALLSFGVRQAPGQRRSRTLLRGPASSSGSVVSSRCDQDSTSSTKSPTVFACARGRIGKSPLSGSSSSSSPAMETSIAASTPRSSRTSASWIDASAGGSREASNAWTSARERVCTASSFFVRLELTESLARSPEGTTRSLDWRRGRWASPLVNVGSPRIVPRPAPSAGLASAPAGSTPARSARRQGTSGRVAPLVQV
jgi:hypothetical protein